MVANCLSAENITSAYIPRIKLEANKRNDKVSEKAQAAILEMSLKYSGIVRELDARTLRWFLYAIIHRESSFNTKNCNMNDGVPDGTNWSHIQLYSAWPTEDHLPHGCGLTQITGWIHGGIPYPNNADEMPLKINKGIYGTIKLPVEISKLTDPTDERQNIERFITEELIPDFILIKKHYPRFSTDEVLRAVAFHWNMGEYVKYNPDHPSYFTIYDQYAKFYKSIVMADAWPDGDLNRPQLPCDFSLGEKSNNYWIEVKVGPVPAESVTLKIDGEKEIALKYRGDNTWSSAVDEIPSDAKLIFIAKINNSNLTYNIVKSPQYNLSELKK